MTDDARGTPTIHEGDEIGIHVNLARTGFWTMLTAIGVGVVALELLVLIIRGG